MICVHLVIGTSDNMRLQQQVSMLGCLCWGVYVGVSMLGCIWCWVYMICVHLVIGTSDNMRLQQQMSMRGVYVGCVYVGCVYGMGDSNNRCLCWVSMLGVYAGCLCWVSMLGVYAGCICWGVYVGVYLVLGVSGAGCI